MSFKRLVDALTNIRTDYSASLVRFLASNKEQTDLIVIVFTSYLFFSFIFAIKFLNSFIVENNYRRMLTRWRIIDKENWWLLSKVYYKLFNKCTFEFILVNIGVVVSMPWILLFCTILIYNRFCETVGQDSLKIGVGVIFHDLLEKDLNIKVTRTDIDNFKAAPDSKFSFEYDFILTKSSFNKVLEFGNLHKLDPNSFIPSEECPICMDEFEKDSEIILLPCGHHFHFECLLTHGNFADSYRRFLPATGHIMRQRVGGNIQCPLCRLNLLQHYLFFKENGLDPRDVVYCNNE